MARVVLDQAALDALARDPDVLRMVGQVAEDVASRMRATAPRRTGRGADSIHSEPAPDPGEGFRVSWDKDTFYMGFQNDGTPHLRARHFAEDAARSVGR
jgi:HK97 gp10 family phage protein